MDYNQLYMEYQDKINKNIHYMTKKRNLLHIEEDIQNEIYIYFISICKKYKENYNGVHIPLDKYLFKHINMKIVSLCQEERKYINRNLLLEEYDNNHLYYNSTNKDNKELQHLVENQELISYIDKLPDKIKNILLLHTIGYKQHEIAELVGSSQSRVCLILKAIRESDSSKFDIESLLDYKLNLQEGWDK